MVFLTTLLLSLAVESEPIIVTGNREPLAGSGKGTEIIMTNGLDVHDKDVKMFRVKEIPEDADPSHVIICKDVHDTGSRIPDRLCRTLRKWRSIQDLHQEEMENFVN